MFYFKLKIFYSFEGIERNVEGRFYSRERIKRKFEGIFSKQNFLSVFDNKDKLGKRKHVID